VPAALPGHGAAAPRGEAGAPGGRFGRMFPSLEPADPGAVAIERLADAMVAAPDGLDNDFIPSGYTYLGQFIDHDLTFDPTSRLERANDPDALVDFRTPRFDLDSLYGSGPADQPFLYDWNPGRDPGVKLLVGRNPPGSRFAPADLPRNAQGRALIGDARNDENLIVSQLTLLFIHFHNRVVDDLARRQPALHGGDLLDEAQRIVRWHYQWIVMHDFLAKLAGDGASFERRCFTWRDEPFMPVEFSAAAFRFGHSMVRASYNLNRAARGIPILLPEGVRGRHLGGFRALPADLVIEWERFFDVPPASAKMRSMLIDTSLVAPLASLPPDGAALARLNLRRGRALGLPAGRDVALALGLAPLGDAELLGPPADQLDDESRAALLRATPLWYYVLREAEVLGDGGQHLGPAGGQIVAEVLSGLLDGDPQSYRRRWPDWRPELSGTGGSFTMGDLIAFTLGGA
jgi:hypothetical protein